MEPTRESSESIHTWLMAWFLKKAQHGFLRYRDQDLVKFQSKIEIMIIR